MVAVSEKTCCSQKIVLVWNCDCVAEATTAGRPSVGRWNSGEEALYMMKESRMRRGSMYCDNSTWGLLQNKKNKDVAKA